MFGAAKRDKAFKDYCLILQVHPEADAAMVDAAYWHLAKRYNEAAAYDPKAKAKLEELNEAYIVLGSAERREEYMKIRVEVLGKGALPQAPRPAPAVPPLAMMSRQRPQERATPKVESERRHLLTTRTAVGAFLLAGLVGVALAATVSLVIAVAVVAAALIAILAVVTVVAGLPQLRPARLMGLRRPMGLSSLKAKAPGKSLDSIKLQAEQLRRIAAKPEESEGEDKPARDADADRLDDLRLQAEQQRRIAVEQLRRVAASQGEATANVSQGAGTLEPVDPEQLDKIKQQTERLRRIAAKFNASKGEAKPDSKPKN